jgi:hypothetical protein
MEPFETRHLGPDDAARATMLQRLGISDLDALTNAALPDDIRMDEPLALAPALTEAQVQAELTRLAEANNPGRAMIGQGYHGTLTPAVIRRNAGEPGLVHRVHALPARDQPGPPGDAADLPDHGCRPHRPADAGASLLDEGTAVAEAVGVARRKQRKGSVVLVDAGILPSRWPFCGPARWPSTSRSSPPTDLGRRAAAPRRLRRGRADACRRRSIRDLDELRTIAAQGAREQRPRHRRRRPAGPHPPAGPGRVGRRHRGRLDAALRRPAVLRRPARRLHRRRDRAWNGSCPAASSACPRTGTGRPRCGWPCRPASSTSAARRRPRTSAPPRCCWPCRRRVRRLPRAPRVCGASRTTSPARPAARRRLVTAG